MGAKREPLAFDLDEVAGAKNYNAWVLGRARPHLGGRTLDFGAGIGTFTQELVALSREVVALEPDPHLRALLEERAPGADVVADDDELTGAFDAIVSFNVVEHIEDDGAVLRRMRELLAPGGKTMILTPAHPSLYGSLDREFGHCRRYTVAELRAKLAAAGLSPLEVRYVNPVGALGWLVASRLRRTTSIPKGELGLFDRLVPLLRRGDRLPVPFGLSVWAVAQRLG